MKKTYFVLAMMLLCCCGCSEIESKETKTTTEPTSPEFIYTKMTKQKHGSFSEFLSSDSYAEMMDNGDSVYLPSWDEEKYQFMGMASDSGYYEVYLKEVATDNMIVFGMIYSSYPQNIDQVSEIYLEGNEEDAVMMEQKNDVTYEVYLNKKRHQDAAEYNLHYFPVEGGYVSVDTVKATPEEAIAYIHEFDLVPAE